MDVQVKNVCQFLENLNKNECVCVDIHDPEVRMSMTPAAKSFGQKSICLSLHCIKKLICLDVTCQGAYLSRHFACSCLSGKIDRFCLDLTAPNLVDVIDKQRQQTIVWTVLSHIADWNLSSTELESGNAIGAFLQAPAPVLDKISGPMGARFLSSTGLRSGNLIERERERERERISSQYRHWIKFGLPS